MAEAFNLNFEWQETRPDYWQRDIDEAERFYTCLAKRYEGSGRMMFGITGFISLIVKITDFSAEETTFRVEKALRNAWLRLRYTHPTIASRVTYDFDQGRYIKSYSALTSGLDEDKAEEWLRQTFVSVSANGIDWCNSDPPAPKIPTLFFLSPPESAMEHGEIRRDLIIRSPHDIVDGIGTLQLSNSLLAHAAQAYIDDHLPSPSPPTVSETKNLSPPLRVAASIPSILTHEGQERLRDIISRNASLRKDVELLTIPYTEGLILPGKHRRTVLQLSRGDTEQLLKACHNLGATVTHVFHASIALRLRNMQEPGPNRRSARYINYCLINERPYCKAPYNTPDHAASVYHSVSGYSLAIDLTIPSIGDGADEATEQVRQKEFIGVVSQITDHYRTEIVRDSALALSIIPSLFTLSTPYISSADAEPLPVPAPNPHPSVSISSMGVIDKIIAPRHGVFKISDPWVTGEELGTGLGVFLGTWGGKLSLSAAWNDAWHNEEEVTSFLRHCQDLVWRGLDLDNGGEV